MRGRIEDLHEQLQAEHYAHTEARRLLTATLDRIPAIEAAQEATDAPATAAEEPEKAESRPDAPGAQEGVQRPWWRRVFGS